MSKQPLIHGIMLTIYLLGGLVVPVTHRHAPGEQCLHHQHGTITSVVVADQADSHSHRCSHHHASSHSTASSASCAETEAETVAKTPQEPADDSHSHPVPHDTCVACQMLSMASQIVEWVSLPQWSEQCDPLRVEETHPAQDSYALLPPLRGPPAGC